MTNSFVTPRLESASDRCREAWKIGAYAAPRFGDKLIPRENTHGMPTMGWEEASRLGAVGGLRALPPFPALPPHAQAPAPSGWITSPRVYGAATMAQLRNKDTQAQLLNSKLISKKQLLCPTRIKYGKHM